MATVNVLIVVDVEGALGQNPPNLMQNVYLVDTNKFWGSYQQGQAELITVLNQGDTVVWSVTPIDPGTNVSIDSFTGNAPGNQVNPAAEPDGSWSSTFAAVPYVSGTKYQYSVVLKFDDAATLSFDPFLQCK